MDQIMEKLVNDRIYENKIELAKQAIALGELTLNQISRAFQLPLSCVEELANPERTEN